MKLHEELRGGSCASCGCMLSKRTQRRIRERFLADGVDRALLAKLSPRCSACLRWRLDARKDLLP